MLSLAAIPFIMVKDAKICADYGMGRSLGTLAIQLAREDVGHHNALDKLIGACIREQDDTATDGFALMSNRASFEMVHKSASVGISSLVAVSAPTALAIREACNSGMNLIGFARPGCHVIYPHHGNDDQVAAVATDHLHKFWVRSMKQQIFSYADENPTELSTVAQLAIARLKIQMEATAVS